MTGPPKKANPAIVKALRVLQVQKGDTRGNEMCIYVQPGEDAEMGEPLRLDGLDVVDVEIELRRLGRYAPRYLGEPGPRAAHHRARAAALGRAVVVAQAPDALA